MGVKQNERGRWISTPDGEPKGEAICVRLPLSLDAYVRGKARRSQWLIEAIREKMEREMADRNSGQD